MLGALHGLDDVRNAVATADSGRAQRVEITSRPRPFVPVWARHLHWWGGRTRRNSHLDVLTTIYTLSDTTFFTTYTTFNNIKRA